MPRPKAILQSVYPYHVTARCINKEWFSLPLDRIWEIMSIQLTYVSWCFKVQIHSFVLMPNHFHMIISTPNSNLDKAMANFMKECSRQINLESDRINQAYGARHFRGVIESNIYFAHAYKYIYRNPVHASLSNLCEDFPFSSLNFLLGRSKVTFPVVYDNILFENLEKTLKWLNTKPDDLNWKKVESAMKKSRFKISKCRRDNKNDELNINAL